MKMKLKDVNSKIKAMGFKHIHVVEHEDKLILITDERHPSWLIADDGYNSWTNLKPFCKIFGDDWLLDDVACEKLDSIVRLMDEVILGHPVDEGHKRAFEAFGED